MSRDNLVKLLEAASTNEKLMGQLQKAASYEEIKRVAGTNGFDLGNLSEEEAMRIYSLAAGEEEEGEELSEDELDMVAGGRSMSFKIDVLRPRFGPTTKAGVGSGQGTCGCNCGNY